MTNVPSADRKIDAIVFDADGTLFDTLDLIYRANVHTANRYGLTPPTRERVEAQMRAGAHVRENLNAHFPGQDTEVLLASNTEYSTENAHTVAMFDGLPELIDACALRGIKLAILTGSSKRAHTLVQVHGNEDAFTSIVDSERVTNQKPHPEGYLLAAQELGTTPNRTIMVGDSYIDVQTGKAAGAVCTVGVSFGFNTVEQLEAAGADYIIDSLLALVPILDTIEQE